MTPLVVEAIYENGTLKLSQALPLKEHEQVRVTIVPMTSWADATYGMIGWKGSHEELEQILAEAEELWGT
jgi:predicted DNA-binding antitoxin AbrB/MazE fold protein